MLDSYARRLPVPLITAPRRQYARDLGRLRVGLGANDLVYGQNGSNQLEEMIAWPH
jgi:hypothetical protein